jgi:hypothetical protein
MGSPSGGVGFAAIAEALIAATSGLCAFCLDPSADDGNRLLWILAD